MIEDSYESRYTQKRARFCGPVSCVQCPKVPLPPIFSPAMLSRPVSCGGFLPSPGMPKHGGMTSGRATRTPFNEMWVKIGSWRTPQDHPCRVYYMRCGGGCQAKISARPALRWFVPLFYAAWRTSAAAARRLQKEAARPALRWPVPLFYAAWRTSAAAHRLLRKGLVRKPDISATTPIGFLRGREECSLPGKGFPSRHYFPVFPSPAMARMRAR